MDFYRELLDQDRIHEGLDNPSYSKARLMLDLYALQDMDAETRLAKSEKLEAAFAKIGQYWAEQGFSAQNIHKAGVNEG